ncbi:UbiA family prenyltransferase [Actinoplanes sp. NPDC051861]|uniref:UbiA family prenyltransferase n=1 Tax=Actinoplanes sp. NPDC051861 TaxID=3155170 RepID=UPI00343B1DB8
MGCALLVGPLFVLGVAGVLLLGWAYSVPPLRLKTRPGWDVAVNAFVVGVLSPAAGWAITRAPWEFPWQFGLIGFLFAAALYVPTTVTDLPADRGAGDTTFAVRFGAPVAYLLGVGLWAAALTLCVVCAGLDVVVPRSTFVPQLFTVPVLIAAYAVLTRRPTIPRMAVVSAFFAIPTIGFALAYVNAA